MNNVNGTACTVPFLRSATHEKSALRPKSLPRSAAQIGASFKSLAAERCPLKLPRCSLIRALLHMFFDRLSKKS